MRFLRGAQHPARAVDAHHLAKNLLHGPGQSRLHPRGTENARDHGALRPHFFLVFRHVAEQKSEHNQIHRTHEQLLRIQFPHAHAQPRQMHHAQPLIRDRLQSGSHRKGFQPTAAPPRRAAVPTVSHNPQRYAAAAITNTKNRKNGPCCAVANKEISTGHTMSAACTTRRKAR